MNSLHLINIKAVEKESRKGEKYKILKLEKTFKLEGLAPNSRFMRLTKDYVFLREGPGKISVIERTRDKLT